MKQILELERRKGKGEASGRYFRIRVTKKGTGRYIKRDHKVHAGGEIAYLNLAHNISLKGDA